MIFHTFRRRSFEIKKIIISEKLDGRAQKKTTKFLPSLTRLLPDLLIICISDLITLSAFLII